MSQCWPSETALAPQVSPSYACYGEGKEKGSWSKDDLSLPFQSMFCRQVNLLLGRSTPHPDFYKHVLLGAGSPLPGTASKEGKRAACKSLTSLPPGKVWYVGTAAPDKPNFPGEGVARNILAFNLGSTRSHGCGSKKCTRKGTLVSGNMHQNLSVPCWFSFDPYPHVACQTLHFGVDYLHNQSTSGPAWNPEAPLSSKMVFQHSMFMDGRAQGANGTRFSGLVEREALSTGKLMGVVG